LFFISFKVGTGKIERSSIIELRRKGFTVIF